jgi:SOS-response transcriptional repressor LexA
MEKRSMTVSELADKLGCSKNAIYNYIGDRGFEFSVAHKLARELNVSFLYLIGESDDDRPVIHAPDLSHLNQQIPLNTLNNNLKTSNFTILARAVPAAKTVRLPLYRLSAGRFTSVDSYTDDYYDVVEADAQGGDFCVVLVDGDSLEPLIHNGQHLLVRNLPAPIVLPARSPESVARTPAECKPLLQCQGGIWAVCLNEDCSLKKIAIQPRDRNHWLLKICPVNPAFAPVTVKPTDEVRVTGRAIKVYGNL